MKKAHLNDMVKGWFLVISRQLHLQVINQVAIKSYQKGDSTPRIFTSRIYTYYCKSMMDCL